MLKIANLTKTYPDGTQALKNVSFKVEPGEFITILGKSGSGKSTLLRCLNRLVDPTSGQIIFSENDVTLAGPRELRAIRRKIGMVFQQYNLVPRCSVLTNVLSGRLGYSSIWAGLVNFFPEEAVLQARSHLNDLGIYEKQNRRADRLSGGQQQRVGIARALMQEPEMILADEPVSSLDPDTAQTIMEILNKINRDRKVTVLCNLHVPELARQYGQRILGLRKGELVFDGSPTELSESAVQSIYSGNRVPPAH
jgi:phosphonate transport system ATP-binding protein